jgi:hypothetical protein
MPGSLTPLSPSFCIPKPDLAIVYLLFYEFGSIGLPLLVAECKASGFANSLFQAMASNIPSCFLFALAEKTANVDRQTSPNCTFPILTYDAINYQVTLLRPSLRDNQLEFYHISFGVKTHSSSPADRVILLSTLFLLRHHTLQQLAYLKATLGSQIPRPLKAAAEFDDEQEPRDESPIAPISIADWRQWNVTTEGVLPTVDKSFASLWPESAHAPLMAR